MKVIQFDITIVLMQASDVPMLSQLSSSWQQGIQTFWKSQPDSGG